jgi:hypothetical protein
MPSMRPNCTPIRATVTILAVVFIIDCFVVFPLKIKLMFTDFTKFSSAEKFGTLFTLFYVILTAILVLASSITAIVGLEKRKYAEPILLYAFIMASSDCFIFIPILVVYNTTTQLYNSYALNKFAPLVNVGYITFIVFAIFIYLAHRERRRIEEETRIQEPDVAFNPQQKV